MSTATIAALLLLAGSDQTLAATSQSQPAAQTVEAPAAAAAVPAEPAPAPVAPAAPVVTVPAEAAATPPVAPQNDSDLSPDETAIVVTARQKVPEDPAQQLNLASYEVVDAADRAIVGPVAMGYKKGLPEPVRDGLHNFLSNLTEPVNFVNFLLQGKPGKAFETLGRFAINTTVGGAGLFDVAKEKPFKLPYRRNGFANTLGYYGIGPGPYMFLPLIGPTTVRDLVGWTLDKAFLPSIAGAPFSKPAYAIGSGTIKSLDDRVEFDGKIEEFRDTGDAYTAERVYYLQQRHDEIEALHGRGPLADKPKAKKAKAPPAEPVQTQPLPATN
ncbi:VacJ family lipoprotein [Novosphingobium sp.]|uniref:MlaA family lipoprotein n=1 Tax=Novosphingobium sp. TaxID=1874826 RepID=UPI0035B365FB